MVMQRGFEHTVFCRWRLDPADGCWGRSGGGGVEEAIGQQGPAAPPPLTP